MDPRQLLLLLQAAAAAGTAQSPLPVGDEPKHHVVFENEFVRVMDASLPPGSATLFHRHERDNVPVVVSGGRVADERPPAAPKEADLSPGGSWFAKGGYSHRVVNVGGTTVRFIDVEVVASPARPAAPPPALPGGHRLELENERVRIYRVTLPPGMTQAAHQHAYALLEVVVLGRGVARPDGPQGRETDARPGDFVWDAEGVAMAVANHGGTAAQIVEIEWK